MNKTSISDRKEAGGEWGRDLEHSRDLIGWEKESYGYFLSWFERWRLARGLHPTRESARKFWRAEVQGKRREPWQLENWAAAVRWYLRWLELCRESGREPRSVPERMKAAVETAGARRGLARNTRRTYGGWAVRYGQFAKTAKNAMRPDTARDWLGRLVGEEEVSFSTQKQALNALVFFFKDVCGFEEVDLGVRLRQTKRRIPVVLVDREEIMSLVSKLQGAYRTMAELQYGSGLRLRELVTLRIKDIDLKSRILTVRQGKGDQDRVTMVPRRLISILEERKEVLHKLYKKDRAAGRPGVALPSALARKMSRSGERWAWFWWFAAGQES